MNDGDLLLARIIADPADDAVRLAYADWLQENGREERAEFVRVQVEMARLESGTAPEDRSRDIPLWLTLQDLRRRERQILLRSAKRGPKLTDVIDYWLKGEPVGLPPGNPLKLVGLFVRGFVECVRGPAADWLAHGDAVRAAHPVTRVVLTTVPEFGAVETAYSNGRRVDDFVARALPHKPTGYRTLAVLMLRWPGVEFELPPANPWRDQYPVHSSVPGAPPA